MLDISDDGLYKFSDKEIRKVTQIMVIKEEGLIALLAGACACVYARHSFLLHPLLHRSPATVAATPPHDSPGERRPQESDHQVARD